jgi:iron-sulfur cluster repair protein YtfE (RIC family)
MPTVHAFAPVHETPLAGAALRDPIEFLRFEHFRQRVLCELLGKITDDPYGTDAKRRIPWVIKYLTSDLTLHVADEEDDLLPLLSRRCSRSDALGDISGALEYEHVSDEMLRNSIILGLRALVGGRSPVRPLEFIIKAQMFEERMQRHLLWENVTVMPLARRRLTSDDLAQLGRKMARRHERAARLH